MANYYGARFEIDGTVLKRYNCVDAPKSGRKKSVLENGRKNDRLLIGEADVVIPDGITEIGDSAFACSFELKSVSIPSSVKKISDNAFWCCCELESVEFGDGIEDIGAHAFAGCDKIKNITLPESVKMIGYDAFGDCNLTEFVVPKNVSEIECNPICGCADIERIIVEDGNEYFRSIGNCLIETRTKRLIAGCKNSVIPTDGSVEEIANMSFDGCSELQKIIIPESVKKIERNPFVDCKDLTIYCEAEKPEEGWHKL